MGNTRPHSDFCATERKSHVENNRKRFIAPLLGLASIVVVAAIYMMATTTFKDVDLPANDATREQMVAACGTASRS